MLLRGKQGYTLNYGLMLLSLAPHLCGINLSIYHYINRRLWELLLVFYRLLYLDGWLIFIGKEERGKIWIKCVKAQKGIMRGSNINRNMLSISPNKTVPRRNRKCGM